MNVPELKDLIFPDCYTNCEIAHYLGVSECESMCPQKFLQNGDPKKELENVNLPVKK